MKLIPWYVLREKIITAIVWRLPRDVVYWCAIRVAADATQGEYSNQVVPDLLMTDALKRWEKKK